MTPRPGIDDQDGFPLRFEWGPVGATVLAARCDVVVVVDVLSFSTAVTVAVERGATVTPLRWTGHQTPDAGSPDEGTIPPTPLPRPASGTSLTIRSPNGATITAALAEQRIRDSVAVLAGCLRNATATARAATSLGRTVAVIAAGERWPDGTLRPSTEDLLAAGVILTRLTDLGMAPLSPEAQAAVAAARDTDIPAQIRHCVSARELIARGRAADVDVATEIDATTMVPILHRGAFTAHPVRADAP